MDPSPPRRGRGHLAAWLGLAFVTAVAYLTVARGYERPAALYWDENYHLASAQKYLHRVHFMEPHPPLGKLLIAAGEWGLRPNPRTDHFLDTDYARHLPAGFSFAGFRLVPVLLAWLTAPVVYLILLRVTGRPLWAVLGGFLYVFDNALLVHLRGAMLEGPLLFLVALTLLAFLAVVDAAGRPGRPAAVALGLGIALGLAAAVKLVAVILVLLLPAIVVHRWPDWRGGLRLALLAAAGALVATVAVWQIHFALGRELRPALKDGGYYLASPAYRAILAEGRQGSPAAFPTMLRDSLRYVAHYEEGVPRLDLCKPGENGSPFWAWPIGARSINYRWESAAGGHYRYLYLQANPVVWGTGLLGIVLALGVLAAAIRRPEAVPRDARLVLGTFLGLYAAYMVGVSRVPRVMYLYHYFLPLILSFLLFAQALATIARAGWLGLTETRATVLLQILAAAVLLGHHVYRPLTYYQPLTHPQVARRALIPAWDLRCVNCPPLPSWWCRGSGEE
jgi:dolichyl-phosphate-mannose--protein O-mannosyl transferase